MYEVCVGLGWLWFGLGVAAMGYAALTWVNWQVKMMKDHAARQERIEQDAKAAAKALSVEIREAHRMAGCADALFSESMKRTAPVY